MKTILYDSPWKMFLNAVLITHYRFSLEVETHLPILGRLKGLEDASLKYMLNTYI